MMRPILYLMLLFFSNAVLTQIPKDRLWDDFDTSFPATDFSNLMMQLKKNMQPHRLRKSTLSFGESHLFSNNSHDLFFYLWKNLKTELQNDKLQFCYEPISQFESSELFNNLIAQSENHVSYPQSINNTNFSSCQKVKHINKFITYSGFHHIIPYHRLMPTTFESTPVSSERKNNIYGQLRGKILSLSQIDFPLLEMGRFNSILRYAKTKNEFYALLFSMNQTLEKIKNSMQPLQLSETRKPLYLTTLTKGKHNPMPKKHFILLTAHDTIFHQKSSLAQELLMQPLEAQSKLWQQLALSKRARYMHYLISEKKSLETCSYYGLDIDIHCLSELLVMAQESRQLLLLKEPEKSLQCFEKNSSAQVFSEITCPQ
jgi:hypothetical protein